MNVGVCVFAPSVLAGQHRTVCVPVWGQISQCVLQTCGGRYLQPNMHHSVFDMCDREQTSEIGVII